MLQTEVRDQRVHSEMEAEEETEMFRMGGNVDFEGLRTSAIVAEGNPEPLSTGTNIRVNDILGQRIEEEDEVFDRDVGESSEDED